MLPLLSGRNECLAAFGIAGLVGKTHTNCRARAWLERAVSLESARRVLRIEAEALGEMLKRLDARFSAPVYPGDLLKTEIWKEGDGEAAYRCLVGEKVVLNNGYVRYQSD